MSPCNPSLLPVGSENLELARPQRLTGCSRGASYKYREPHPPQESDSMGTGGALSTGVCQTFPIPRVQRHWFVSPVTMHLGKLRLEVENDLLRVTQPARVRGGNQGCVTQRFPYPASPHRESTGLGIPVTVFQRRRSTLSRGTQPAGGGAGCRLGGLAPQPMP